MRRKKKCATLLWWLCLWFGVFSTRVWALVWSFALVEFWRITLWRILLYLENIAILGDLATLWSLDYHALVLVWRVVTLEELGGLWHYTWRGHGGFVDDLVSLIDDMEVFLWRLGAWGASLDWTLGDLVDVELDVELIVELGARGM